MVLIYRILTILLWPFVNVFSLFVSALREFLRIRKNDLKRILSAPNPSQDTKVVWLHAASVGELDQCRALAKVFRQKEPKTLLLQSVTSSSVRDSQLEAFDADIKFRLPMDFPWSYNAIFIKFRPEILVLMSWDRWPNLLLAARKFGTRSYLSSAVPPSQKGWLGRKMDRSVFALFTQIFPAHASSEQEFKNLLGAKARLKTLGDCRIDTVVQKVESNTKEFSRPNSYPFSKILVLASTYEPCESLLLPLIQDDNFKDFAFWIFPHKTSPDRIQFIESKVTSLGKVSSRYTSLPFEKQNSRIIVFDVLGLLAFAYKSADFAYVGGGLHNRVHNVLEPAYFGLPILTGPKIDHSSEAKELKRTGGLFTIRSLEDAKKVLLLNEVELKRISRTNRAFLESGRGAGERTYLELRK
ncbi:3-deoxy-D-manno-octulosonic acid transferase [Leptospira perolatii]|uniref:3-deoxy-D-manno-octulosonic acid transferase n=1 Tax=Leptospira perolatii TaxID=2023191 RepID=A0A2M9ZL45_9LEPT|nr:glycosyltransferase N-terminal domain-containing protein [Leptospira perolatii]PJZ70328.1 3-deoxy-D-manno-octulosonic acid transferase [Leptospira perolatii]PJZ72788.1 3-deoxy-D-manno-octulosonic acid transferase [Leptospira perolatii]